MSDDPPQVPEPGPPPLPSSSTARMPAGPPPDPDAAPPVAAPAPPTRRAVRAATAARDARDAGPSVLRTVGIPLLIAGCAAAVLVSSLTLPGRGEAVAATGAHGTGTASAPASAPPARTPSAPARRSTTTAAVAPHDGTRVTLTLTSRPRSRTDQEFGFVGRHLGTAVLDDPVRSDGDTVRRSASFDVGRGGFVVAWRSTPGWTLESLACTTTDGNLATTVRSTVVVVTAGRGEVRCSAVVAKG